MITLILGILFILLFGTVLYFHIVDEAMYDTQQRVFVVGIIAGILLILASYQII